jgi:hypothetical protein
MVMMHLAMMNRYEELEQDLILGQQVSGDSPISAGDDQQSPGSTRGGGSGGCMRAERPVKVIPCPRCQSMNTKFCYYNNYSVAQPRHFCRNCQRYWTVGGTLRNVPVGGGSRKKVQRTRQQRCNDSAAATGQQLQLSSHDPRRGGGFNGSAAELLNMTLQSNLLHQLPNTMQMAAATQQAAELSNLLQQATAGGRSLGSNYIDHNQFLQSGLMQEQHQQQLPPGSNTATSQLQPTFFQFSNMDQRGHSNAYSTTGSCVSKSASAQGTGGLMNHQDHTAGAAAVSMLYDHLQSNHAAAAALPNSTLLQMGNNNNIHGSSGFSSNGLGYNHPQSTMQDAAGNHIEFLSSVMHKPAYWGA